MPTKMAFLNEEQMEVGSSNGATLIPGQTANVVLTEFAPFKYGDDGKQMPKYYVRDAHSGKVYEFVGFKFHEAVKQINDAIEANATVVHVTCIKNEKSDKYHDYELTVVSGAKAKPAPEADDINVEDIPF